MILSELLRRSAEQYPNNLAISSAEERLTYAELEALSNQIARALQELGVKPHDRVGVWLPKSTQAVAAMQGVLKLGAAYVPIDPMQPTMRAQTIMLDCAVSAVIALGEWAQKALTGELAQTPRLLQDGEPAEKTILWSTLSSRSASALEAPSVTENDLAYILYTSGSTGKPKGVCISHLNAFAFVEWAAREVAATPNDRFSCHAPFHFDLTVLDLYVPFLTGASVSLVPDGLAYVPERLVEFILQEKITVWYSVPSALSLMMDKGGLLEVDDASLALRVILFAGEPFPIKPLRRLRERWAGIRMLNLYGPTETNVCTFYEVLSSPIEQAIPIGKASCGDRVWAVKEDGSPAGVGEEGELWVSGPTVMLGYWGQPLLRDKPYPTGDLVKQEPDGNFIYVGRRDHMVKVRGHRIELGEIEATLSIYPGAREAAAVIAGQGPDARIVGCLVMENEASASLLSVKRHCAERLPRYMIIHELRVLPELPRTRNGKVDRLRLSVEEEK